MFNPKFVQEVGTYIQDPHSAPSIKGKSRSASKKRTVHFATDSNLNIPHGSAPSRKNKVSTSRPSTSDVACTFNITVICSKIDNKWYLRYQSGKYKCDGKHTGHIPVHCKHISQSIKHLPHDVDTFIQSSLENHVSSSAITQLVLQIYNHTITEVDICHYRNKISYNFVNSVSDLPYGTQLDLTNLTIA